MMPSALSEILRFDRPGPGFCGALVFGQAVFLAYLLHLDVPASVLMALLVGLPLALACYGLLTHAGDHRGVQLTAVMFAAGGFGMLLGCLMDFGSLGLYGLLGICRSLSPDVFWPNPEQLWFKISLMPWACVGMLIGGNLGMALYDVLHRRAAPLAVRAVGLYGACNVGMFLGMVLTEQAVTRVTTGLGEIAAGTLMMTAMLAGMVLGMSAVLALVQRLPRIGGAFGHTIKGWAD